MKRSFLLMALVALFLVACVTGGEKKKDSNCPSGVPKFNDSDSK